MGRTAQLLALGSLVGLLACAGLGRLLASLLYGVDAADPAVLAVAIATAVGTGFAAALLPSWRAGASDPATLLRRQ